MGKRERIFVVWMIFLLVQVALGCAAANADFPAEYLSGSGDNGAVASVVLPAPDGGTAAGGLPLASPPVSWEACLKEGAPCSPLDDKCCDGYYCFGGVIPTCVRKL